MDGCIGFVLAGYGIANLAVAVENDHAERRFASFWWTLLVSGIVYLVISFWLVYRDCEDHTPDLEEGRAERINPTIRRPATNDFWMFVLLVVFIWQMVVYYRRSSSVEDKYPMMIAMMRANVFSGIIVMIASFLAVIFILAYLYG